MRLLTYNILKGGQDREAEIVEVIQSVTPDVVVVQEALEVEPFRQVTTALGMSPYLAVSAGTAVVTAFAPPLGSIWRGYGSS